MSAEDTELFEAVDAADTDFDDDAAEGVEAAAGAEVDTGLDGFPLSGVPVAFAAGAGEDVGTTEELGLEGGPQVGWLSNPVLALHLAIQELKSCEPLHDGAPKVPCKEAIAINATRSKDGIIAVRRERV
jgi:hypothetical protein